MIRAGIALAVVLAFPGTALAQAAPDAAPKIDLHTRPASARCAAATDKEVVVCGSRERSPYRLDETVVDAERSKDAANNPRVVQDRSGGAEPCGTVRNECGGGMIPLLGPALRVATAIVDAAKGEDWKQAFRNGPTDYERYQDAKRKRAKGGISVGISVGTGNER